MTLTSGSSPYTADARAGGSLSEITVDQNAEVGATEPVNTATGDFSGTTTDLTVPGAGVPLQFTRTYVAEVAQAQSGGSVPPLGYGWSDNLGMSLSYSSPIATITEENGAQVSFTSSTTNARCSGLTTNFCGFSPRIEATLNHNGGGTWTFSRLDGSMDTFTFSSAGVLQSITDANGDTVTPSTYTGSTPSCPAGDTCIGWTSSASGRELVLATNSSSQLVEVFVVGTTTDKVTNAYSATGCTWGAMTADLCSVICVAERRALVTLGSRPRQNPFGSTRASRRVSPFFGCRLNRGVLPSVVGSVPSSTPTNPTVKVQGVKNAWLPGGLQQEPL